MYSSLTCCNAADPRFRWCGLQTSFDTLDRSRMLIGSQRCVLPEKDLYDFDEADYRYYVECTAGDEITEPGYYNASIAVEGR